VTKSAHLSRRARVAIAIVATCAIALSSGCGGGNAITVSAAASLGDVVADLADEFERQEGIAVDLNLGGSNSLASQIALGAPVDVAIFAGDGPMERLVREDHVDPNAVVDLIGNRLIVVGRSGTPPGSFPDVFNEIGGRIAIADPLLAPAGTYAVEVLQSVGAYEAVEPRILPTLDVRSAVAAVESGSASLAIVYGTDALAYSGVEIVAEIPASSHRPIVYPAAIIARTKKPLLAARFIEFLQSDAASAMFTSYGFTPLRR
jgi:molybdate transport system substrate-binding protein